MNKKLIDPQGFVKMLENYKSTLEEMCALADEEIKRVHTIGDSITENHGISGKEASIFVNKQMNSFLDKLAALVKEIPDYTLHGCFTPEEMESIRQRALIKLKELVDSSGSEK